MMISYIKWCDKGFTKSEKSSILTSDTPQGRGDYRKGRTAMRLTFKITGMSCAACSATVERTVRRLEGVRKADVNLLGGSMAAEFDENVIKPEDIVAAVVSAGYGAELPGAKTEKPKAPDNSGELRDMKRRFVLSLCFLVPLMYLTMGGMVGLPQPPFLVGTENALMLALTQMFLTLPVMFINRAYYTKGLRSLWHRSPNMDSLIAVGSGAAAIYGVFVIYRMAWALGHGDMDTVAHYAHDLYFESAATILTLITLGKFLETPLQGPHGRRHRTAARALARHRRGRARRCRDGDTGRGGAARRHSDPAPGREGARRRRGHRGLFRHRPERADRREHARREKGRRPRCRRHDKPHGLSQVPRRQDRRGHIPR